jgi:hypothetical protein
MKNTTIILTILLLALSASSSLTPSHAHALDLQIPIQVGFDYRSDTDKPQEGTGERTDSRTNFALQLPIIFKFHPKIGVGPAFRLGYIGTSNSTSGGGQTTEASSSGYLVGLGLMLRSDVHEFFAIQFSGFYDFGSFSTKSGANTSPDTSLSGYEFRLDLMGRAKIGAYKTWLELGPYFFYQGLTVEPGSVAGAPVQKTDRSTFGVGLALQGTFEFGI